MKSASQRCCDAVRSVESSRETGRKGPWADEALVIWGANGEWGGAAGETPALLGASASRWVANAPREFSSRMSWRKETFKPKVRVMVMAAWERKRESKPRSRRVVSGGAVERSMPERSVRRARRR